MPLLEDEKLVQLIRSLVQLYKGAEETELNECNVTVCETSITVNNQPGREAASQEVVGAEQGVILQVHARRQTGIETSYLVSWDGQDEWGHSWQRSWNEEKACQEQDNWEELLAEFLGESDFVPETSSSEEEEPPPQRRKRKWAPSLPPLLPPSAGGRRHTLALLRKLGKE